MASHFYFKIDQLDYSYAVVAQRKIRAAFSSLHSLGILEDILCQFACVQQTLEPKICKPKLLIYAGDHGINKSTLNSTYTQLLQLVDGSLPVNRVCHVQNLPIQIVDAGVNHRFPKELPIVHAKIGMGTQDILIQPAMSLKHGQRAVEKGAKLIQLLHEQGCNLVGFGDVGVGSYLSASAIAAFICNLPLDEFLPYDLSNEDFINLSNRVFSPVDGRASLNSPLKLITTFGGYELAQMVGAMLQAAEKRMVLLIDGFIPTIALLVARWAAPNILDYCVFCCETMQTGHSQILSHLNARPILTNLPENSSGIGVALAYSLIVSELSIL